MADLSEAVSGISLEEKEKEEVDVARLPTSRTAIVFDTQMLLHCSLSNPSHPECPQRISRIWDALEGRGYVARCLRVPSRKATRAEVLTVHTVEHVAAMERLAQHTRKEVMFLSHKYDSIYLCKDTYPVAMLCAGCVVELTEHVVSGKARNGVAVVRPPGHHAEADCCKGFCIFNGVAIATKTALDKLGLQRVLIVDWDIHHGNGTQNLFYKDKRVLYFSLHRYDNGMFYPGRDDAMPMFVGEGEGEGFNINVAWSGAMMGDEEYLAAFHRVLLPVAYEFNPDLVIVSSGLDAALGDPLGHYRVTPGCYAHMTHLLSGLANGRVIIVLEGGYNLTSISDSMCACTAVLLGDPLPRLELSSPNPRAEECISDTIRCLAPYWKFLQTSTDSASDGSAASRTTPRSLGDASEDSVNSVPEDRFAMYESNPTSPLVGTTVIEAPPRLLPESKTTEATRPEQNEPPERGGDNTPLLGSPELAATPTAGSPEHAATPTTGASADGAVATAAQGWSPVSVSAGAVGDTTKHIMQVLEQEGHTTMFAVVPLTWCEHLEMVNPLPDGGINASSSCEVCGETREPWVCLSCYHVYCGRYINEHMVQHCEDPSGHRVVLSLADLSVWCFACDSYVDNPALHPAKDSAHRSKFGSGLSN